MKEPLIEHAVSNDEEVKPKKVKSIAYTIERKDQPKYEDWCKYIKKESDKTLYN